MAKEKHSCNQCQSEMQEFESKLDMTNGTLTVGVFACANPACPNYALVQISAQLMPKEDKRGKKE
jgi:hypothetical protein